MYLRHDSQHNLKHIELDLVLRKVADAERVLEAFARRACEDVINTAQLAQVSEPLELRRVHDQYCRGVQLDVVMDGVLDDLHGGSIVVSREADDRQ